MYFIFILIDPMSFRSCRDRFLCLSLALSLSVCLSLPLLSGFQAICGISLRLGLSDISSQVNADYASLAIVSQNDASFLLLHPVMRHGIMTFSICFYPFIDGVNFNDLNWLIYLHSSNSKICHKVFLEIFDIHLAQEEIYAETIILCLLSRLCFQSPIFLSQILPDSFINPRKDL